MDARFPERWLNDRRIARASDSQFRLLVNANAWAVSNRTDGHIPAAELSLIPRANTTDADALVALGLWEVVEDGWMIAGFLTVQTPKGQLDGLDERRAKDAQRSRRYRSNKKNRESRDESRDEARDDTGQDRTGQALYCWDEDNEHESKQPEPVPEAVETCQDCADPLDASGTCRFCGPRTEALRW